MVNALGEALALLLDPVVIAFIVLGCLWGALCGCLPGIGSGLAIGVMIPFTFGLDAVTAVAFIIAINVAVAFGNSIPAVLLGLPGTPSAVLTALDGYALHKRGQSGLALGISWFGCVAGQFISTFFFVALVVPLSGLTYTFLSPELFALYFLGLTALVSLTGDNILKGLAAATLGLAIALIGTDPVSAVPRFDFGIPELRRGVAVIPFVLGLVTVSELIRSMRQTFTWDLLAGSFSSKFPPLAALRRVSGYVLGGSVIGTLIGAIPGLSGSAAAVMSYQQARLISRHPEEFGKGSVEGLAVNEAAQNGDQAGELVPTLGLGIPGSDTMVLLLSALTIQGIIPGPLLMQQSPQLLYATIAGLLGGTLFLFVAGWHTGKLMLRVVLVDRRIVLPMAFVLTLVGVYALRRSTFDVYLMLGSGLVGYFMLRYGYSTAAAAVGLILGAGMEANLRQGLLLADADLFAFVSRPWTAGILILSFVLLLLGVLSTVRLLRRERGLAQADRSP